MTTPWSGAALARALGTVPTKGLLHLLRYISVATPFNLTIS